MRKRNRHARMERAGLLAVESACNDLNLIWRDILQEDVGVDGTIEIVVGDFPSGKIVAAQVKSGSSYIRSETSEVFKFYPREDDLEYWGKLSIPLLLLVHHPKDGQVYWVDVSKSIHEKPDHLADEAYILFSKSDKMDEAFASYLRDRFDLATYDEGKFKAVSDELKAITLVLDKSDKPIILSAHDIFVSGLWGMCTKVVFHSSVLTSEIRRKTQERKDEFLVRYNFERTTLYPFITQYINVLCRHNLALLDVNDINETLYTKYELPTFIAPLSTNGRIFVEYLRSKGTDRVHDNQLMTLSLLPLEQIEVYESFDESSGEPRFGPYIAVINIKFNPQLDYYEVEHWRKVTSGAKAQKVASQTMFFFELTEYLERVLGEIPKDNILMRHLDLPMTPLICWLEDWYGLDQTLSVQTLSGKSNAEQLGLHDEMAAIFSGVGSMSVTEPPLPKLPILRLGSGEIIDLLEDD